MKDLTIFINGEDVSVEKALKTMTDDWVDEGNYCTQTVIDLRDALKEIKELEECAYAKASEYIYDE